MIGSRVDRSRILARGSLEEWPSPFGLRGLEGTKPGLQAHSLSFIKFKSAVGPVSAGVSLSGLGAVYCEVRQPVGLFVLGPGHVMQFHIIKARYQFLRLLV